jgi:hypothetical protein
VSTPMRLTGTRLAGGPRLGGFRLNRALRLPA